MRVPGGLVLWLTAPVAGFAPSIQSRTERPALSAFYEGGDPSDYDPTEIEGEKHATVDENEEDAIIRDALKRELLLLSSITNRGEFASKDEQNIVIDLVSQLEALNPTPNPAENSQGEWDLALSSTQFFRSSPFFQSIRMALNDPKMAENVFDIHDRATTASRIGRVRQTITNDSLESDVDLEVGVVPGLPFRVKGTVVTTAALKVTSPDMWELQVESTQVKGSNVPILNQFMDDLKLELPVSTAYQTLTGDVPKIPVKTYYIDEGLRISRDVDDNFFVWTRA